MSDRVSDGKLPASAPVIWMWLHSQNRTGLCTAIDLHARNWCAIRQFQCSLAQEAFPQEYRSHVARAVKRGRGRLDAEPGVEEENGCVWSGICIGTSRSLKTLVQEGGVTESRCSAQHALSSTVILIGTAAVRRSVAVGVAGAQKGAARILTLHCLVLARSKSGSEKNFDGARQCYGSARTACAGERFGASRRSGVSKLSLLLFARCEEIY